MKKTGISYKRRISKWIYLKLLLAVDLSEHIYNKLKYIKDNPKKILVSMFEEEDKSTMIRHTEPFNTNDFSKIITDWFGSLFGEVEEELVVLLGVKKAIRKQAYNFTVTTKEEKRTFGGDLLIFRLFIFSILNLIFLIYYSFT